MRIYICLFFIAIFAGQTISSQNNLSFDAKKAYDYTKKQTDMGPRNYGSKGYKEVQSYIKNEIKKLGYNPHTQTFKAPYIPNRTGENIYAFLKGKSKKYIIIASHYDTRSVAEKDESFLRRKEPIIGANDGASSTGVLLALMSSLKNYKGELPYSVAFVFFDLEDDGGIYNINLDERDILETDWIQGSIMFAKENIIPKKDIQFGILLDMVGGKNAFFKFESIAYRKYSKLYKSVWDAGKKLGYGKYFLESRWAAIIDDHIPFVERSIPFINIIDMGYRYHHTHEDTIDKIDLNTLKYVGETVEYVVKNANTIEI